MHGPGGREFPVRRIGRCLDRKIVGVTFDANLSVHWFKNIRTCLQSMRSNRDKWANSAESDSTHDAALQLTAASGFHGLIGVNLQTRPSTGFLESTVNQVVSKRMVKKHQIPDPACRGVTPGI